MKNLIPLAPPDCRIGGLWSPASAVQKTDRDRRCRQRPEGPSSDPRRPRFEAAGDGPFRGGGPAGASDAGSAEDSAAVGRPARRSRSRKPSAAPSRSARAPAVRRPMRYQLRAMGKVFVPQPRKGHRQLSLSRPDRRDPRPSPAIGSKPGQKLVTLQSEEVGEAKAGVLQGPGRLRAGHGSNLRTGEAPLRPRRRRRRKTSRPPRRSSRWPKPVLNAAEKKLHVLGFTEEQVQERRRPMRSIATISLYAPIAGKIIDNNAGLGRHGRPEHRRS